jgi:chorismate dehydratase
MDAQSLFAKKDRKKKSTPKKLIAVGNDIDDKPLFYGLQQYKEYNLKFGTSIKRFEWITQGSVELAFISAIDFSRLKGGWKVLPKICKSTRGPSKRTALFFNKNLNEIESIAIPANARTSEIVLKIILKELYQIDTKFIKLSVPLKEALQKCDAALLTGDQAIMEMRNNPFHIDLGEEWYDLTGLPLVYGFWIGNELTCTKEDFKNLVESCTLGLQNVTVIAGQTQHNMAYLSSYLSSVVNYNLGDEEQSGLEELYRFSFFYGFADYIPDFNFAEVD